jgi:hypothetical protein
MQREYVSHTANRWTNLYFFLDMVV